MFFINGYEVEFYEGKDFADRVAFNGENQFRTALRHAAAPKTMQRRQKSERKAWERQRIRAEQELVNLIAPLIENPARYKAVKNAAESWLERWATKAYEAGMAAAGIGDLNLDASDENYLVKQYLASEQQYMRAFLSGIRDGKVSASMSRYRARLYSQTLDAAFYVGLVSSFPWSKATKIHWVLGFAEHCTGCVRLSRRVWTPLTIPTTPRAGATQCKANCKCSLEIIYDATVKLAATPARGRGTLTTAEGEIAAVTVDTDDAFVVRMGVEQGSPLHALFTL